MAVSLKRSLLAAAVLAALVPSSADAQIAPRIVIAFDTSGSMVQDLDGNITWGDGVTTGCSFADGRYCGDNCTAGLDTNCDGEPNDSRIQIAKTAVRNMILAFGDVDWSLARFPQISSTDQSCNTVNDFECNLVLASYGNPQCNNGADFPNGSCPFNFTGGIDDTCEPGIGSDSLALHNGSSPDVCINYGGVCGFTGSGARTGDILVGFPDIGPFAGMNNSYGILSWLNGVETNFNASSIEGNFCDSAGSGDCELRPTGGTPLAGLLTEVGDYIAPIRTADSASACRPYSVILITDGQETCDDACDGSDPANCTPPRNAAAALLAAGVNTYVVGLAITGDTRTQLNNIATAGGTDAGTAGGDTAYFADDPETLSAGLADIVRRSLLVEVCNSLDDDCDTFVDEGVANACGGCGAVPTEDCDGDDDDCDGRTDEGVSNACGTCGPPPVEICNRADDDCDGNTDEDGAGGSVCDACTPTAEICDNVDNDCDGPVDEGLSRACGTNVGECTAGTQVCSMGSYGTCTGETPPATETCNGLDDDCDGVPDDGVTRACGSDVGQCVAGTQLCVGPDMWGACIGEVTAGTEVCDGEDDDCDTRIDEGVADGGSCGTGIGICTPGTLQCMGGALTCVGGTSPDVETCNGLDDDCDTRVDEGVPTMGACGSSIGECREGVRSCVGGAFVCVGNREPGTELCNNLDDDCDDDIDEMNPGGGAVCGTDAGVCSAGTTRCLSGALVCDGETTGSAETCNLLDDDCDGLMDEANPGGGAVCGASDEGLCSRGALACVSGALTCVGETGPSAEICDGADNDCDGDIDEMNPEGGAACGDATGACMPGTLLCTAGALVCDGAVGPTAEVCNGIDDDCDGVMDDGIPVGAACGTDVGECVPGVNLCREGGLVCEGAIAPEDEVCDNLDNDCDGSTDEGLGVGTACGSTDGLCMPGVQRCIAGRLVCEGEVGPRREACDCTDNDCDGAVDEAPETGALCPEGSACVECQCAVECTATEFGFNCPTGKTPRVDGDSCFCVAPLCDEAACGAETVEREGEVLCAPDADGVTACVCSNNECTFSCDGVVCDEGTVCNPRDPLGRCVENSCRGLGCLPGQICDETTGECEVDACEGVTCPGDQACRNGACETTCASVSCGGGERCRAGACETDPCDGVSCEGEQICLEGTCDDDRCASVRCADGQACDPADGSCGTDPCNALRCPSETTCEAGECVTPPTVEVDAGVDAGGVDAGTGDGFDRVLAAGGCACRTAPTQAPGEAPWALLALVLGGFFWRRRRSARGARPRPDGKARAAALAAVVLGLTTGCEVEPFCLNCTEPLVEEAGVDAGHDAGSAGRDSGVRDAGVDGGADGGDACLDEELCNDLDDDCDGTVDEGIDTNVDLDNCGACGTVCAPLGAFGACNEGSCEIDRCDVGRLDIDGDPANGCEYRCLVESEDDAVCDRRDNDCDTNVDEDVALDTDPTNCGACGVTCSYANGTGACEASTCRLDACDENWFDIDGSDTNGCEYSCTPADPATETCNGRDDDCDGTVDEGDPEGGGTCGSSVGRCLPGTETCVGGTLVCTGGVEPDTESCNGMDDDCDSSTDEGNPGGGRVCGTSAGTCTVGREACTGGALVCEGQVGPAASETCDNLDNDCDGTTDEGNPGGGASCGTDTGACVAGTLTCAGGTVSCVGATAPVDETCNGMDDDCDGMTDEGNPGGGASCGTDLGICVPGTLTCTSGTLSCVGESGPAAGGESCNGLDDDCDNSIDEGNPGAGGSCGSSTGQCSTGTFACVGGSLQCQGGSGPTLETCDTQDDDCDGATDEDFTPFTSLTHCGGCNTPCALMNATATCASGTCEIAACDGGFVDFDGSDANGCEYACDNNGAEVCNGIDDDCDMRTDEGVSAPPNFCDPDGVCAATSPTCNGAAGWECVYPSGTYEENEESCDGLDNDCDGVVDDPFPTVDNDCANGTGACRRTGFIRCASDGMGTECDADPAGRPAASELCNNMDDDCDGTTDEDIPDSAIETISIPRSGGGTVEMMVYEASRPDASSSDGGQVETRACSNANVMPWTSVTWTEAQNACCALNPSGTCSGDGSGWRLCDAPDWQTACEADAGTCEWSYASSCSTSQTMTCNGEESGLDALAATGGGSFAMCFADWDTEGVIYDLSGNVKEWTATESSADPNVHQIRGGSYNNVEDGRACGFDFTLGDNLFSFTNTGFRCCQY
ncbi:MAG: MopE-related protein [Sandaracinaceae bacterium]